MRHVTNSLVTYGLLGSTMAAQPMQIDSALQALLNPSTQVIFWTESGPSYDPGAPANADLS